MAKELNTRCRSCGYPVSPGCDFCSRVCKRKGPAKAEKPTKATKILKAKVDKKTTPKKKQ